MTKDEIRVEWFGHSFILIDTGSARIAIDPHDGGSLNIQTFRITADYLLITHDHYDHNAVEVVDVPSKSNIYVGRRGSFTLGDIKATGHLSYHDKAEGSIRGTNTVYVLEINEMKIVHAGDIGDISKPDGLKDAFSNVDILILPVGGTYTIDAYEAWKLVEETGPRLVIPVHYWIPYSTLPLDPLEKFLNIAKARRYRSPTRSITVSRYSLPEKTTIVVMPPPMLKPGKNPKRGM